MQPADLVLSDALVHGAYPDLAKSACADSALQAAFLAALTQGAQAEVCAAAPFAPLQRAGQLSVWLPLLKGAQLGPDSLFAVSMIWKVPHAFPLHIDGLPELSVTAMHDIAAAWLGVKPACPSAVTLQALLPAVHCPPAGRPPAVTPVTEIG